LELCLVEVLEDDVQKHVEPWVFLLQINFGEAIAAVKLDQQNLCQFQKPSCELCKVADRGESELEEVIHEFTIVDSQHFFKEALMKADLLSLI
jgi:hypothetical protein